MKEKKKTQEFITESSGKEILNFLIACLTLIGFVSLTAVLVVLVLLISWGVFEPIGIKFGENFNASIVQKIYIDLDVFMRKHRWRTLDFKKNQIIFEDEFERRPVKDQNLNHHDSEWLDKVFLSLKKNGIDSAYYDFFCNLDERILIFSYSGFKGKLYDGDFASIIYLPNEHKDIGQVMRFFTSRIITEDRCGQLYLFRDTKKRY